jgi:glycosyl transferase family 25
MDKYSKDYLKLKNKYKNLKNEDTKNGEKNTEKSIDKHVIDIRSKDWDFVDKILYINLEDRKDRRKEIEEELKFISNDKIMRFNAIKHQHGYIGCVMSHIACLDYAIKNDLNNIMILEDDASFSNYKDGIKILKELLNKDWDVITLGNVGVDYDKETYKLNSAQTTTGYIVNNHYFKILRKNFMDGMKKAEETHDWPNYALDQYWKKLQKKDNWYIVVPSLVIQRPSFSSICNQHVDYTGYFN